MIDVTDAVIRLAQSLEVFNDEVYREYPSFSPTAPYAVIVPTGRLVLSADDDGSELLVSQTFTATVGAKDLASLNEAVGQLADILARHNVQTNGYTAGFDERYGEYTAELAFSVTADKRGLTFR